MAIYLLVGVPSALGRLAPRTDLQVTMAGVNAAIVGLLLTALYTPV